MKHTALSEANETKPQPSLLSDTSHAGRLTRVLVINTPTEGTEAATGLSVGGQAAAGTLSAPQP